MTVNLAIDYRSPTPLDQPLEFVAESNRLMDANLHDRYVAPRGHPSAEASGLFISMWPEALSDY